MRSDLKLCGKDQIKGKDYNYTRYTFLSFGDKAAYVLLEMTKSILIKKPNKFLNKSTMD